LGALDGVIGLVLSLLSLAQGVCDLFSMGKLLFSVTSDLFRANFEVACFLDVVCGFLQNLIEKKMWLF
jgi:hypothetical protein